MKTGDVIRKINGRKVENTIELRNRIASTPPGSDVQLDLWREGRSVQVNVRLSELPGQDLAAEEREDMTDKLGFTVSPLTPELTERYRLSGDRGDGIVVTGVLQSGNAYRAGLREGDLILSVNRKEVPGYKAFLDAVAGVDQGELLFLLVERKGSKIYFAFNL